MRFYLFSQLLASEPASCVRNMQASALLPYSCTFSSLNMRAKAGS